MNTLSMPKTIYQGFADFGPKIGQGNMGDYATSFDGAHDMLANYIELMGDEPTRYRILRTDFDVETGLPESTADVTEDVYNSVTRGARDGI